MKPGPMIGRGDSPLAGTPGMSSRRPGRVRTSLTTSTAPGRQDCLASRTGRAVAGRESPVEPDASGRKASGEGPAGCQDGDRAEQRRDAQQHEADSGDPAVDAEVHLAPE